MYMHHLFQLELITMLILFIAQIKYMPLSVIITTFTKEKVKRPLEGFGVLIPTKEQKHGFKTLGNMLVS